MFAAREFLPERASPVDWRLYHAFRRRRQAECWPEDPLEPDQLAEAGLRHADPFATHHRWYAVRDGSMVSLFEAHAVSPVSPEYAGSRHLLWTHAMVLRPHRRRGIGRSWLSKVVELADKHRATVVSMRTEQEPGHAFLRWLGAEPRFTEAENRLDLRDVDWGLVSKWAREGPQRLPRSRLELHFNRLPAALVAEFCQAVTELVKLVPWEQADHGEEIYTPATLDDWYARLELADGAHHVCLAREADGSIAGLTDMVKYRHETGLVRQQLTAVRRDMQGRGLGKWLKAAMLQMVLEAHPDTRYVSTQNARSNAPILAINHRLGFRLHRVSTDYQIPRDALAERVRAS